MKNFPYFLIGMNFRGIVSKQFASCFPTLFLVQTSVVVMFTVSVEVAAAASVFYLTLLINSRKDKKKKWVRDFFLFFLW